MMSCKLEDVELEVGAETTKMGLLRICVIALT